MQYKHMDYRVKVLKEDLSLQGFT